MSEGLINQDIFKQSPLDTLKNELFSVGMKVKYTILMLPGDRQAAIGKLKQWDLWGPLLICFIFSLAVGLEAEDAYAYENFVNVFIIFWLGAMLIGINCRLLGNKGSIFQSVSVIGYCMLPIAIFGLLVALLPLPGLVNLILMMLAMLWSVVSSMVVMRDLVSETKKVLCAYPILLFYIYLAWYAVIS